MNNIIIEGIDRIGKSSLIEELRRRIEWPLVSIHSGKPWTGASGDYKRTQRTYFDMYINLMRNIDTPMLLFDRFHIGEWVYSPVYRGYYPEYMREYKPIHNLKLVLMYTSDFSIIKDDGQSFDFMNKEKEQDKFITAFELDRLTRDDNKKKIRVDSNGKFRSFEDIFNETFEFILS